MNEEIAKFVGSVGLAGLVTMVANLGFDQTWNYFIVLLIVLVIVYGGFLIMDSDGDLW